MIKYILPFLLLSCSSYKFGIINKNEYECSNKHLLFNNISSSDHLLSKVCFFYATDLGVKNRRMQFRKCDSLNKNYHSVPLDDRDTFIFAYLTSSELFDNWSYGDWLSLDNMENQSNPKMFDVFNARKCD